jgi:hypothetical protein
MGREELDAVEFTVISQRSLDISRPIRRSVRLAHGSPRPRWQLARQPGPAAQANARRRGIVERDAARRTVGTRQVGRRRSFAPAVARIRIRRTGLRVPPEYEPDDHNEHHKYDDPEARQVDAGSQAWRAEERRAHHDS